MHYWNAVNSKGWGRPGLRAALATGNTTSRKYWSTAGFVVGGAVAVDIWDFLLPFMDQLG
jgi:hypothetical protein